MLENSLGLLGALCVGFVLLSRLAFFFTVSCLVVLLCVCASIFVGHVAVVFCTANHVSCKFKFAILETQSVRVRSFFFVAFECVVCLLVLLFSLGQCLL